MEAKRARGIVQNRGFMPEKAVISALETESYRTPSFDRRGPAAQPMMAADTGLVSRSAKIPGRQVVNVLNVLRYTNGKERENSSCNGPPSIHERFCWYGSPARPRLSRPVSIWASKAGSCPRNQGAAVNSAVERMGQCQFRCRDYAFGYQIDTGRPRSGSDSFFRHPN